MTDLFGNERPDSSGPSTPAAQLSLLDAAAERIALESGRSVTQERLTILYPPKDVAVE